MGGAGKREKNIRRKKKKEIPFPERDARKSVPGIRALLSYLFLSLSTASKMKIEYDSIFKEVKTYSCCWENKQNVLALVCKNLNSHLKLEMT